MFTCGWCGGPISPDDTTGHGTAPGECSAPQSTEDYLAALNKAAGKE